PSGTTLVTDIVPGVNGSSPTYLNNLNGNLLFVANDGSHLDLWTSDGTATGTVPIATSLTSVSSLVSVGTTAFFSANDGTHGVELWKTDGTPGGTVLARDIQPGAAGSSPNRLTNVNGKLFFTANDGTHGSELWSSDGTSSGTVLVKDITSGSSGTTLS